MIEANFQRELVKELERRFPGAIVMKNDPSYIQGIPDLTMLYRNTFVAFECKRSKNAAKRPNQQWYVDEINRMGGLAYFIYPENAKEILNEVERDVGIEQASRNRGETCSV